MELEVEHILEEVSFQEKMKRWRNMFNQISEFREEEKLVSQQNKLKDMKN